MFGPTASGKTAVAETLEERIPAETVSADSMQLYWGLRLLTAQPHRPTRLVAMFDLDHETSVGEYQELAHAAIDDVLDAGRTPVVAGGTGLYFRAALADIRLPPPPAPEDRQRLEGLYDSLGPVAAHDLLARRDPGAAARIHPNDRRRVVRALELVEAGSSLAPSADRLWGSDLRRPAILVGLQVPADVLEQRIQRRTEAMFAAGVEDEVRNALRGSVSRTARQIIGLEEIATLPPLAAREAILVRTRRYAAYQRKWMRRIPGLATVAADRPPGEIADDILDMARSRERVSPQRGARPR